MNIQGNDFPAYPVKNAYEWQAHGMTLRDYFAAKAMQGFLTRPGSVDPKQDAALAYVMADAMLKAREANHG